ncbi:hypothetical protein niasHT_014290 [Heterodera trifolii]|uniref:Uncharacterized protein n=1 Tax=Heterodera trifolii TaxID=157864 RepID=A0ABD2KUJ0_9BILA
MVERGGPRKRGGPRRPDGGTAARGPRYLTQNNTTPPIPSVADWLTRRPNHHLGFNPARRNSRAFNAHGPKSRATPIQHPQIPTPHRPAHQPQSRTHISRRIPHPHPAHHPPETQTQPPHRHGSSSLRSTEKINR